MSDANRRLMTLKSDLGATRVDTVATPEPAEGEVVLALDRFSLTTNNITYAAYGDAIGYWKVFPTGHDDCGLMPVWVARRCGGLGGRKIGLGFHVHAAVLPCMP